MSPALIYSNLERGGLGLIAIPLAIKGQAMRRITTWLVADDDVHKACWEMLAQRSDLRGYNGSRMTPASDSTRRSSTIAKTASIQVLGERLIRERLVDLEKRKSGWQQRTADAISKALEGARIRTERDGGMSITLLRDPKPTDVSFSELTRNFWATCDWAENPLVVDSDGKELAISRYRFLEVDRMGSMGIERTDEHTWRFKARLNGKRWMALRRRKLAEWIVSIIACSPELKVAELLRIPKTVWLMNPMVLQLQYTWRKNWQGLATRTADESENEYIVMAKESNGICCTIIDCRGIRSTIDAKTFKTADAEAGITFVPHPAVCVPVAHPGRQDS